MAGRDEGVIWYQVISLDGADVFLLVDFDCRLRFKGKDLALASPSDQTGQSETNHEKR